MRDDGTVLEYNLDKFGYVVHPSCGRHSSPLVLFADDWCLCSNRIKNKFDRYDGMPHYFWVFPQLKDSERFHANVVEGVRWVLSL